MWTPALEKGVIYIYIYIAVSPLNYGRFSLISKYLGNMVMLHSTNLNHIGIYIIPVYISYLPGFIIPLASSMIEIWTWWDLKPNNFAKSYNKRILCLINYKLKPWYITKWHINVRVRITFVVYVFTHILYIYSQKHIYNRLV